MPVHAHQNSNQTMKNTSLKLGLGLASLLLAGANAIASPIATTTYGGNKFDLYDATGGITWANAEANAVSVGGHLAALTSAGETTAVYAALINHGTFTGGGQYQQAWLGGYTADHSGSTSNPFNWAWVNGAAWTAFDVSNFASGEPNGDSSGLAINRFGTSNFNDEAFTWQNNTAVQAYIVETALPDGGNTLGLLGLGLVAVGAVRRKLA